MKTYWNVSCAINDKYIFTKKSWSRALCCPLNAVFGTFTKKMNSFTFTFVFFFQTNAFTFIGSFIYFLYIFFMNQLPAVKAQSNRGWLFVRQSKNESGLFVPGLFVRHGLWVRGPRRASGLCIILQCPRGQPAFCLTEPLI